MPVPFLHGCTGVRLAHLVPVIALVLLAGLHHSRVLAAAARCAVDAVNPAHTTGYGKQPANAVPLCQCLLNLGITQREEIVRRGLQAACHLHRSSNRSRRRIFVCLVFAGAVKGHTVNAICTTRSGMLMLRTDASSQALVTCGPPPPLRQPPSEACCPAHFRRSVAIEDARQS